MKADRPPAEPQAETAATTAAYSSEDVVIADRTAAATATTAAAAVGNEETADQAAGSRMGQLVQRSIVSLQSIPKVTKNTKSVGWPPCHA